MEKHLLNEIRSLKIFISIFLFLTMSVSLSLAGQDIKILEEKLISGNIQHPVNEVHLITDPGNSNHLLTAAILTKSWKEGSTHESYIVLLQSWNGGKSWEETHFDKNITYGADPWLSMNKKGTVVLSSLTGFIGKKATYLVAFISRDAGKTWDENPVNLGSGHDRESIVVDPVSQDFIIVSGKYGRNNDNRSIFGIMVSRLSNTGDFKEAVWHPVSNLDKNNSTPLITQDKVLIVPFVDYMHNDKMIEKRRNWIIKSRDMGRTFSEPILLSEGGNFPEILLDTFDVTGAKLHYLKPVGQPNEYLGYTVCTSADFGYTWSKEVDIDQYDGIKPYIREAQWAINNKGKIAVFWFDRRDSPDMQSHNLYFTYSVDHARTFAKPVKLSSGSSKPLPEKNGMVDKIWPTGGHYFGVNPTIDGGFRVVWVDHRNGKPQLFHAVVGIAD